MAATKKMSKLAETKSNVSFSIKCKVERWNEVMRRLDFQRQARDERGVPSNLHILDSIRELDLLYRELAALCEVERILNRFGK